MKGTTRSYININPQLSSVITSLGGITGSIDSMKEGWWKRPVTATRGSVMDITNDSADGADGDGAPTVSFSSSSSSPRNDALVSFSSSSSSSPRNDALVSFVVDDKVEGKYRKGDDNNFGKQTSGVGAATAGSNNPSPSKSCLRKTDNAMGNVQEISIDSTDERELDGSKTVKTAMERSFPNQNNDSFLHQQNKTPSPTNFPKDQSEDGSDATHIYPVDETQNSETQLDHEFGNGSFEDNNCWSNETHTLNQSCPIPSDDLNVSPIFKIGSQMLQKEPPLPDCGEGEAKELKKPSSNTRSDDNTKKAAKQLDMESNTNAEKKSSQQEQPTNTSRKQGKRKIGEVHGITTALDAEGVSGNDVIQGHPKRPNFAMINDDKNGDKYANEDIESHAPFVFLLSSPMSLPASDLRCLRKCLKKEKFFMFQKKNVSSSTRRGTLDNVNSLCSDLDFNFNFELEDDRMSFLSMLFQSTLRSKVPSPPDDDNEQDDHPCIMTQCCYAICSNSEFQTCDGFIAPRSFQYLLAVACGLPIVDISYIRSAALGGGGLKSNGKNCYLHPMDTTKSDNALQDGGCGNGTAPRSRKTRTRGRDPKVSKMVKAPHHIVGDVQSGDWIGPKRARAALLERLSSTIDSSLPFNNGLLSNYTILLNDTYDTVPIPIQQQKERSTVNKKRNRARSTIGGGKQAKPVDDIGQNLYSRGRLSLLLTLCGAKILELKAYSKKNIKKGATQVNTAGSDRKVVVLSNGDQGFCDLSKQLASSSISVTSYKWVLDSIAEFTVKNIDDYSIKSNK